MCSGDACKSNACCNLLLDLYCKVYQLYLDCPPSAAAIAAGTDLNGIITNFLTPTIQAIFPTTKCGKVSCCDGLAAAILCAFSVALSALTTAADTAAAQLIFNQLDATLTGILTLGGFTAPAYLTPYPPGP